MTSILRPSVFVLGPLSTIRKLARIDETASPRVDYTGGHPALPFVNAGEAALMIASEWGRTEVVRLLLDRGADPNRRSNVGATALKYVRGDRSPEIVRLLRDHGAKE